MHKTFVLVLLGAVLSGGCAKKHQPASEAIAEIRHLKVSVWPGIYAKKDAQALEEFLANDFVLIAGGNVSPKEDEVAWLNNSGDWSQADDFSYEVKDVVIIAPNAAIVYGKGSSTRTNESGERCAHTYWSSNTLRRVNGKWHPVTSHVSDAKCEPT